MFSAASEEEENVKKFHPLSEGRAGGLRNKLDIAKSPASAAATGETGASICRSGLLNLNFQAPFKATVHIECRRSDNDRVPRREVQIKNFVPSVSETPDFVQDRPRGGTAAI